MHTISIRAATTAADSSIISGLDPSEFSAADPIRMFIIQAGIIIIVTRVLAVLLAKIRQPPVIAEVIGGIILGPTVCGRIPGFTEHIFPPDSLPYLNLVANIGLVFFLFLIGLEVDLRIIRKNALSSTAISLAGLILPFGLGSAVAWGLYDRFINKETVGFNHFLLFAGTAFSITALPVLARILVSLNMLQSKVGTIVLAAGVGNDVVGWVLLALTVALVNASNGLNALYILLTTIAWTLVLFMLIKPAFHWLARRTGSLGEKGPTQLMLTVTILLMFTSAFFTDVIGVHAIFGAFLVGLIIPHEGGFAVHLTEKIEDLVQTTMLPLFFALSGLKTQLGTLDEGIVWAYVIAIIVVAFASKFIGCAGAAKLCGFNYRESAAIGTLMSCKGLVELIVLNIGLNAGILDTRTFSMFVLMAIVSTCMTTPLTLLVYPYRFHEAAQKSSNGHIEEHHSANEKGSRGIGSSAARRLMIVLDGFEHLPGLLTLVQLMRPSNPVSDVDERSGSGLRRRATREGTEDATDDESTKEAASADGITAAGHVLTSNAGAARSAQADITIDALRLVELSERTSAVMRVAEGEDTLRADPITNVFRTFGHLNHLPIQSSMAVVPSEEYSQTVINKAVGASSNLIVVPWTVPAGAMPATNGTAAEAQARGVFSTLSNPFESIFGNSTPANEASPHNLGFVRRVFQTAPCDVGLLVDRNTSANGSLLPHAGTQHVLLSFMGGPDDRAALSLVLALGRSNTSLQITVLRFRRIAPDEAGDAPLPSLPPTVHHSQATPGGLTAQTAVGGVQDTMYPTLHGSQPIEATLEDDLAMKKAEEAAASELSGRLTIKLVATSRPLRELVRAVEAEKPTLLVLGRGRRQPTMTHRDELRFLLRCGLVDPDEADTTAPDASKDKEGERALSSETCKIIGEPAMAVSRFANTGAATLVLAASMRPVARMEA